MSNGKSQAHPKLFLFCIGGTGSRVLKALTFLLAAGVDIKASQVIPIIIDPDRANGDMNRTIEILNKYQYIRNKLEFENNRFFSGDIQTLGSLEAAGSGGKNYKISSGFNFDIDGTKDGKFRKFIGYDQLDEQNKALVDVLFSEDNLNAELRVGFKGNPHMGSVVLNQFKDSDDFKYFASRFNQGDRIFIVSSIFGGTGAAGFPLLVKNIREANDDLSNHDRIKNAPIGAITILPYFGVMPDASIVIDKGTFVSKAKAALYYYSKNLTGNNSLNALYYIGDTFTTDYPASEGEKSQKNDAHLIELLSALSIIDYMDIPKEKLENNEGKANSPFYKEYGLNGNDKTLNFKSIGKGSRKKVAQSLIQYALCNIYWKEHLNKSVERQVWSRGSSKSSSVKLDKSFFSSDFFSSDLSQFNDRFWEWLSEMARNQRSFEPLNLSTSEKTLHKLVIGIDQTKTGRIFKSAEWDFSDFDNHLNTIEMELEEMDATEKFMALFYKATEEIYRKKLSKPMMSE